MRSLDSKKSMEKKTFTLLIGLVESSHDCTYIFSVLDSTRPKRKARVEHGTGVCISHSSHRWSMAVLFGYLGRVLSRVFHDFERFLDWSDSHICLIVP